MEGVFSGGHTNYINIGCVLFTSGLHFSEGFFLGVVDLWK